MEKKEITPLIREQLKVYMDEYGCDVISDFCTKYKNWLNHREYCLCKCYHECEANPKNYSEKKSEYMKKYYRDNKEKIQARNKAWYEKNVKNKRIEDDE